MRLTQEQFDALAPYQMHFETMVKSKWSRHPGSAALDKMHDIYTQVTGSKERLNKGCQHCIMKLIENLGVIYLADLAERNANVSRTVVKESLTTEAEPVKVEVKTKRKYTRKPKTE